MYALRVGDVTQQGVHRREGSVNQSINQSVIHSCIITVVQVIKSLQDPLEVGNN